LDDSNRLGDTYVRLSKLLWHSDQLEAWHVCQEGLKVLEGEPDSPGYARLLAEAGRVALFRKETDQIMPLCQRALEMAERLDEMEVYVDAKITIAIHVDDIRERISILEEVIELAEASGLLRSAARAHINLSNYLTYVDINSTLRHLLQAAEISRQISEIDMMMFALNMLAIYYPELGELDTLEEKLADFLRTSTMPESRENEFWLEVRRQLMIKRGEWEPAVEATRKRLEVFRERSDIQQISHTNSDLVEIILEMNRYGKQDDLSEAESALRENLELDFYHKSSLSKMVIIFARQGCNAEARDYLTKSLDNHSHDENDLDYNVLRLDAEFELAFAEEHWSGALAASESLIKIFENSGQRWNWARMLIDLGDALAARNEPGDLERAKETYQQSLDMFTEMGAPGYIKVLEERLENL
jgi:tetratricopeptide (TPR) repeat protein